MKHTKQTRLTAALFAAAMGASVCGNTASAAFSPEDQRMAAVVYGPPPVTFGDGDGNNLADARDLTLLKRRLLTKERNTGETRILHEHYSPNYMVDFNPKAMDLNQDDVLNPADVRMLRNRLTGQQTPTTFCVRILAVPYFADDIPEDAGERLKLLERASRLDAPYSYDVFIMYSDSANPEIPSGQYGMLLNFMQPLQIRLDCPALPDPDNPDRTTRKATVLLRRRPEPDDYSMLGDLDNISMPRTQQAGDILLDLEYLTRVVLADGSVRYYDKLEIEYNMLTGEVRIGNPIPQDAEFSEWDYRIPPEFCEAENE